MFHKSSFFHKIQYLVVERQSSLNQLEQCCQQMSDNLCGEDEESYDLEKLCDYVDHVRKTSMCICENIWEMFQHFKYKPHNRINLLDGKYYIKILARFDQDLRFLKQSLLRYYVPFSNDFDPLLIESAKPLRRYYAENKIVYNHHVDELFRLNASYLYRLLRAHQRMLSYYMLSKDYEINEQEKLFESREYQYQSPSHCSNNKLEKKHNPVLYRVKKPQTEIRTRKLPLIEKQDVPLIEKQDAPSIEKQEVKRRLLTENPPTLSAQPSM